MLFLTRVSRLTALLAFALLSPGCRENPAPTELPSSFSSPSPLAATAPTAGPSGSIAGRTFETRTALVWQDTTALWLSFEPVVPATNGRFDPRATRVPTNSFQVFLDPEHVRIGRFEAQDGHIPTDSPVRRAVVQNVNRKTREIQLMESGWRVTLTIDRIIERKSKDGTAALSVAGVIDLRFDRAPARLQGPFFAHDLLRDDEAAADEIVLPAPAVSPGPSSPPSPSRAAPTSPGRTD